MTIEIFEIEEPFTKEIKQHVIIDRGNGEFTSMPKSVYDERQKALKDAAN